MSNRSTRRKQRRIARLRGWIRRDAANYDCGWSLYRYLCSGKAAKKITTLKRLLGELYE